MKRRHQTWGAIPFSSPEKYRGRRNIEQVPGLRPRVRCDVSCKTCVSYLAKGHTGKGFCDRFKFWTFKKWVCDAWKGAGIYKSFPSRGQAGRAARRESTRRHTGNISPHMESLQYDVKVTSLVDALLNIQLLDAEGFGIYNIPAPVDLRASVLYIDTLQIPKTVRGRGWGKRFAQELIKHGQQRGAVGTILLAAPLWDQMPSQPFWERMGFRVLVQGEDTWGDGVAVMWRANK